MSIPDHLAHAEAGPETAAPARAERPAPAEGPQGPRPHVLVLCDGEAWDRIGPIVRRLAVGLVDEAIRVSLLCDYDCPSSILLPGLLEIHNLHKPGYLDLLRPRRRYEQLMAAAQRSHPTLIHAISLGSLKTAMAVRQALDLPMLVGVDAVDAPRLRLLASLLGPDCMAAPLSEHIGEALAAHTTPEAIRDYTEVVRPGIYIQTRNRPPFEPGAPVSMLVIQAAGRATGLESILRATAQLLQEQLNVMLFFIDPGAAESDLRRLAVQLQIHEHVTFTGRFSRWPVTLGAADIVVLPQTHRQVFIYPMETMASATLMAAAAGHCYDAITDGVTGLVFDPADWRGLAAKLAAVLKDPHRARSMAYAGQEKIRQHHSVSHMVTSYVGLYERLSGLPSRQPGATT